MEKFIRYAAFYGLLAAIVGIVMLMSSGTEVSADITNSAAVRSPKTINDTLEGWQYKYNIAPQGEGIYWANYDYNLPAPQVKVAVNAMNQAATRLAKSGMAFNVTLVFAKPLPLDDFKAFVSNTGISPSVSYIQAIASDGQLAEASIPPSKKDIADGKALAGSEPLDSKLINAIQTRQNNPLKVLGVVTTDVTLTAETYAKIIANGNVYAFDVTPYLITQRVEREYPDAKPEKIQVARSLLYNAMQRAGIAPKGK